MHALYIYTTQNPQIPADLRYDALYTDNTPPRPSLHTLLTTLQPYDTLFLLTECHLSKSLRYALSILHSLAEKNVTVHVLRNNVAYAGKNSLFSSIPLTAPEQIRKLRASFSKRRCKGGIDRARKQGMYNGRKKHPLPKNFMDVVRRVQSREINYMIGSALCHMKYSTFVHAVHMLEENPPQYHTYQRKPEVTEAQEGTLEHYTDKGLSFNDTMLAMYDDKKLVPSLCAMPRNVFALLLELFQAFRNYKAVEYFQKARQEGRSIGRKKVQLPKGYMEVAQRFWQGEITGLTAAALVKMAYSTFMHKTAAIAREKGWGERVERPKRVAKEMTLPSLHAEQARLQK